MRSAKVELSRADRTTSTDWPITSPDGLAVPLVDRDGLRDAVSWLRGGDANRLALETPDVENDVVKPVQARVTPLGARFVLQAVALDGSVTLELGPVGAIGARAFR
jgi:hypothetical protein